MAVPSAHRRGWHSWQPGPAPVLAGVPSCVAKTRAHRLSRRAPCRAAHIILFPCFELILLGALDFFAFSGALLSSDFRSEISVTICDLGATSSASGVPSYAFSAAWSRLLRCTPRPAPANLRSFAANSAPTYGSRFSCGGCGVCTNLCSAFSPNMSESSD